MSSNTKFLVLIVMLCFHSVLAQDDCPFGDDCMENLMINAPNIPQILPTPSPSRPPPRPLQIFDFPGENEQADTADGKMDGIAKERKSSAFTNMDDDQQMSVEYDTMLDFDTIDPKEAGDSQFLRMPGPSPSPSRPPPRPLELFDWPDASEDNLEEMKSIDGNDEVAAVMNFDNSQVKVDSDKGNPVEKREDATSVQAKKASSMESKVPKFQERKRRFMSSRLVSLLKTLRKSTRRARNIEDKGKEKRLTKRTVTSNMNTINNNKNNNNNNNNKSFEKDNATMGDGKITKRAIITTNDDESNAGMNQSSNGNSSSSSSSSTNGTNMEKRSTSKRNVTNDRDNKLNKDEHD